MKGHVRPRGKGTWAVILDIGRGPDGRRRQKWHTVKGTKKDAEAELAKLMHHLNTGAYVEPAKMTVAEYLERWLQDYAKTNVSPKTLERYAQIVRNDLSPAIGQHLLPKLQPLHIQSAYTQALTSGRKNGKGGLSAQTVLHHHRVLREALQQAVRWQLLARNPADAVEPPRPQKTEMRALAEQETGTLAEAARGTRVYVPTILALATGARRGELLALQWADIDLQNGTAAIRRSLEETAAGLAFKSPKTQKGRRIIALPGFAIDALKRHRIEQAKERLQLGAGFKDNGLVFPGPFGEPWKPSLFTCSFLAVARRSGLTGLRFHDLRHTHASQLLKAGIHPKVVSERLGHSTIGITLDVYSHVMPGMQEEAARRIDTALRAALQGSQEAR